MELQPVIETKNLSLTWQGQMILDKVNLTVYKGDFFAIIGPNGGGKTTLIKAILGLIHIDEGEIILFSHPADSKERRRIGYVPQYQSFDFNFPITALEMVLTGRIGKKTTLFSRYSASDIAAATRALQRINAEPLSDRPIAELSGGERQRVLIARALAGDPQVLILDEPTIYVDTPTEEHFFKLLTSLAQEITILMVTHDIGVVSQHVNRVACLNKRLYQHESDQVTGDMISRSYGCPIDLITHGHVPHRVLPRHEDET